MMLVAGRDAEVASWAAKTFHYNIPAFQRAFGVVDKSGNLVGAAIYQEFNGFNVELSYYGPNTVTRGIVKQMAYVALELFKATRMTIRTTKKNKILTRGLPRLGFQYECTQKQFYGPGVDAVCFVIFRNGLARLMGQHT